MRLKRLLIAAAAASVAGVLLTPAGPASAHPLGNFSVNQYTGLTLRPSRVDVLAVADIAEIPTLQEKPSIDTSRDGSLSPAERAAFASSECHNFAAGLAVLVSGARLMWTVGQSSYIVAAGAGGLSTSRLTCSLSAPASLSSTATVRVDNSYRSGRVGWCEITATASGVRLSSSTVPQDSVSGQLHSYPRDLLTSAPDVRSATISVGGSGTASAAPAATLGGSSGLPSWLSAAQSEVESALGGRMTPLVIALAFLLAVLLGAGHAALPGHGKTVMAAYFAGRRGRIRDALAVGGTVTLAHTGGVILVGLLLSTSTALAGEQLLTWLGVTSGALVAAVGIAMLVSARRARATAAFHSDFHNHGLSGHSHSHDSPGRSQSHGLTGHSHGHSFSGHSHSHGPHGHHHHDSGGGPDHRQGHDRPGGRLGLGGIGLAGGLVPSPSALVVLLGAIGLGRAGLGVLLVVAYGIGMAGTLTAVGLLLVVAQRCLSKVISQGGPLARGGRLVSRLSSRISASAPTATAALVVVVGLGMGFRAVG